MTNTNQVFNNPSIWANYCRSTIPACTNKDSKQFGSAWSIIRYMGKRLDSYKLRWYRKQKKQYASNGNNNANMFPPTSTATSSYGMNQYSTGNNSGKGKHNQQQHNNNLDNLMFGPYSGMVGNGNGGQYNQQTISNPYASSKNKNTMDYSDLVSYMNRGKLLCH